MTEVITRYETVVSAQKAKVFEQNPTSTKTTSEVTLDNDTAKPGLESLAAPGRARMSAQPNAPAEKQIITTADVNADGGRPCLALFKAHPRNPAGPWIEIERHRLGTQTFIPLAGARYVVLVALGALDDTRPDESTLAAFAVDGHQAVTLRAGVWHHSLLALQASSFVVIERSAPSVDCDIANLSEPVSITVPPEFMQLAPQSVAPA